jgi:Uncharacterized conserved protein
MNLEKPVIIKIDDTPESLNAYETRLETLPKDSKERMCIMDYPAVYIHSRKTENGKYDVYIGETNNVFQRTREHFDYAKSDKNWQHDLVGKKGAELRIIGHPHFNKSLTLDVENRFMLYLSSVESTNPLKNGRSNEQGSYYTSDEVYGTFAEIWKELHKTNAHLFPDASTVEDSAIFKASPFHKLYPDQEEAKDAILSIIHHALVVPGDERGQLIFVEGESGTGKTVLNSTLFYELCSEVNMGSNEKAWNCHLVINHDEQLKVYLDIAKKLMLTSVDEKFITKPTTFINQYYKNNKEIRKPDVDVVFVDEAHLLWSQGKQSYQNKNMIEDLRKIAKVVVLMFDQRQVMHIQDYWDPSYINALKEEAVSKKGTTGINYYYQLTQQLRITGGEETVQWIKNFTDKQIVTPLPYDKKYDLRVFESPFEMEEHLKSLISRDPEKYGLSRILATFDWPYTDGKGPESGNYWMVEIDTPEGVWKKPWNKQLPIPKSNGKHQKSLSWAEQLHTIDEVGSTFTIQGSDLNVAAVILGPSVRYKDGKVWFDASKHADKKAIQNRTMDDGSSKSFADMFISNEVNVLMKRGVNGLYIYACDPDLRRELRKMSNQ